MYDGDGGRVRLGSCLSVIDGDLMPDWLAWNVEHVFVGFT